MTVTQSSSLSSILTDPLRNFKWQVTFRPANGKAVTMYFMTLSGLSLTIDTIPYREGGYNVTTQKMPGQADFGPITLTKGVMLGTQFMIPWVAQLFTVVQGTGSAGAGADFRSTVEVQVLDHPNTSSSAAVKAEFTIFRAWPTSLAYSDLDAGANQLFISQMTLAHEGFTPSIASAAGDTEAAPVNLV
jgi:phage tail-like protein